MYNLYVLQYGAPRWLSSKESACQCRKCGFSPWVRKIPLEKDMAARPSIIIWEIPETEELQSWRHKRVRHESA